MIDQASPDLLPKAARCRSLQDELNDRQNDYDQTDEVDNIAHNMSHFLSYCTTQRPETS